MTFDWTQYTGNLKWLPERTLYLTRHAIHDSAHLGLPLYKILPDEKPVLLDGALLHLNAHLKGSAHRSELL